MKTVLTNYIVWKTLLIPNFGQISHLFLFHVLSLFTWITSNLIGLFFLGFSSRTRLSRASFYCLGVHLDNFWSYWTLILWLFIMNEDFSGLFFTVQARPFALNAVIPGRWPSLMRGLLWNHLEISDSYLDEVDLFWDLPR